MQHGTVTQANWMLELLHPLGLCPAPHDWQAVRSVDEISHAASHLQPTGMLWAEIPPGTRAGLGQAAAQAGLEIKGRFALFSDATGLKAVVPLALMRSPEAAALTGRQAALRQMAARLLGLPGALDLFEAAYPSVGFALGRRDSPPLAAWMGAAGPVLLRRSWHSASCAIGYLHDDSLAMQAIAKIPNGDAGSLARVRREEESLRRIASAAAGWGAEVPEVIDTRTAPRPMLATRALRGECCASLLQNDPFEMPEAVERVTAWLAGWNAATRSAPRPLRELEDAATVLSPHIRDAREYFSWLNDLAGTDGRSIPRVASHGDLSMWNLVLTRHGGLGILDWEEARESDLPLLDLFYALFDAASACACYEERLIAFRRCFFGAEAGVAGPSIREAAQRLQLSESSVTLLFHLCWLHHAANQVQRGAEGPFLEIVRLLAESSNGAAFVR
jgi:hypothetical protein